MKKGRGRITKGLIMLLTSTVFAVIVLTVIMIAVVAIILIQSGIADRLTNAGIYGIIALVGVFAVLFGTGMTFLVGSVPLRPISVLGDNLEELAKGNYSVRSDVRWPRAAKKLSRSFNLLAEELGSTEMLRSDFVNNFSHEFKTPIVSIRGYARLLKQGGLSQSEQEEYLDIIINESGRLSELAINVLNLSKIENRTAVIAKKRYNLAEQIRQSVLMLEPKWEKKELELDVELDECVISGSEEFNKHIWTNLIDNAIKFSENGGKLELRLTERGDNAVFRIRDEGCGMDEQTQQRIFDKFYQGDTSHAAEGNGVGLALVKKAVDISGGAIHVKSAAGEGTEFTVVLPLESE